MHSAGDHAGVPREPGCANTAVGLECRGERVCNNCNCRSWKGLLHHLGAEPEVGVTGRQVGEKAAQLLSTVGGAAGVPRERSSLPGPAVPSAYDESERVGKAGWVLIGASFPLRVAKTTLRFPRWQWEMSWAGTLRLYPPRQVWVLAVPLSAEGALGCGRPRLPRPLTQNVGVEAERRGLFMGLR